MFMFAGFSWAIWTTRNKMAIEKKFPKAPSDVIYCAISFDAEVESVAEGGRQGDL